MKKRKSGLEKFESYTYNHIWIRYLIDYGTTFLVTLVSAIIFALGFNLFIAPSDISLGSETYHFFRIVSGGSSGIAQTIAHLFELIGIELPNNAPSMYSVCYLVINAPLIVLAFVGIGKRFGFFTLLNVSLVFCFTNIFHGEIINNIALFFDSNGGIISRALFAGICTGFSSAIAYYVETSAGGLDILFYYLSLRRNTLTGKYAVIINFVVVLSYSIITGLSGGGVNFKVLNDVVISISSWEYAFSMALLSIVYLVMVMIIIDLINIRNKKVQLQIITSVDELPELLIANIPHGATVMEGKGAFSGDKRLVIYLVIGSTELKNTIHVIRELDPNSFINVTSLQQVYGRFFLKPVK